MVLTMIGWWGVLCGILTARGRCLWWVTLCQWVTAMRHWMATLTAAVSHAQCGCPMVWDWLKLKHKASLRLNYWSV